MNTRSNEKLASLCFWAFALPILTSSCVTGTAYQRAVALQADNVSEESIFEGLRYPNWKVRCFAADACGRSKVNCSALLASLLSDRMNDVRVCALDALLARCNSGGRVALASAVQRGPLGPEAISAVKGCPSSDAVWAVVRPGSGQTPGAVQTLLSSVDLGTGLPLNIAEQAIWYEKLLRLPPPREEVEFSTYTERKVASEARAAAREVAARTKAAADEEAALRCVREEKSQAEYQQKIQGDAIAMLEAARRDAAEGDPLNARVQLERAQSLGVTDQPTAALVDFAAHAEGEKRIAAAWLALKNGKVTEAKLSAEAAAALGVRDERFAKVFEAAAQSAGKRMIAAASAALRACDFDQAERNQNEAEVLGVSDVQLATTLSDSPKSELKTYFDITTEGLLTPKSDSELWSAIIQNDSALLALATDPSLSAAGDDAKSAWEIEQFQLRVQAQGRQPTFKQKLACWRHYLVNKQFVSPLDVGNIIYAGSGLFRFQVSVPTGFTRLCEPVFPGSKAQAAAVFRQGQVVVSFFRAVDFKCTPPNAMIDDICHQSCGFDLRAPREIQALLGSSSQNVTGRWRWSGLGHTSSQVVGRDLSGGKEIETVVQPESLRLELLEGERVVFSMPIVQSRN